MFNKKKAPSLFVTGGSPYRVGRHRAVPLSSLFQMICRNPHDLSPYNPKGILLDFADEADGFASILRLIINA